MADNVLSLDTHDFLAFARALRRAEPVLAKELNTRLRAAGQLVAEEARVIAAEVSTSVPPSIKVRMSRSVVTVQAGGSGVPLAGLLEIGNKGSRDASTFRHPVFGTNAWVEQPTHPFLKPAMAHKFGAAEEAAQAALDAAIREAIR